MLMARALWKGAISFGLVTIPVSLYPAKDVRDSVSFHLLHRDDLTRVHNKHVDEAGHEVAQEDIVKGYEYERDSYVVLEPADLKRANVEATQTIDIMLFVDAPDIDITYYDTPYYTEPTKAGRRAYALLRETIRRTGKVGVGRIVIRERQHLCAILADGPAIIAYTLRWPYQLRGAADLDLPSESLDELAVTPQELKMADQLVEAMVGEWQPEQYRDTYRDDLLRMIDEKVKGGKVTARKEPKPAEGGEVVDIMALLRRSVEERRGPAAGGSAGSTPAKKHAAKAAAEEPAAAKPTARRRAAGETH
jgi:DNA end-binding protein Ku